VRTKQNRPRGRYDEERKNFVRTFIDEGRRLLGKKEDLAGWGRPLYLFLLPIVFLTLVHSTVLYCTEKNRNEAMASTGVYS
jgi:hypothetical protein